MAQVKIYGLADQLRPVQAALSEAVHGAVMAALAHPPDKRFPRFFPLDRDDFLFPHDRSERYTIVEISMFAGRSLDAKRRLIGELYRRVQAGTGIEPVDLEITITETPRHDWGIRGVSGDELTLGYRVEV